jgi:nicotinamide/nicotinate riboside kinase
MSKDDVTDRALIIGLSGPSSSGKTTLARLLRTVFNISAPETTNGRSTKLFIFHQDDTYKTDTEFVSRHAM